MQLAPQLQTYDEQEFLRAIDPENRLEQYYQLLAEENSRINLVSRETLPETGDPVVRFAGLRRLAAESLYPITQGHTEAVHSYLDIGSGGGFPSVPVVLTRKPDQAVLVERTLKKAAALGRIVAALECPAQVEPATFEELKLAPGSFDLITLRLVRLTEPLLKKITRLLRPDGTFVYYSDLAVRYHADELAVVRLRYSGSGGGDIHTATIIKRIR